MIEMSALFSASSSSPARVARGADYVCDCSLFRASEKSNSSSLSSTTISVFDLETFIPSKEDIAYLSSTKMPTSPAQKISGGVRIAMKRDRMGIGLSPATIPNPSLEEAQVSGSLEIEAVDHVLQLERVVRKSNEKRAKDLEMLLPTQDRNLRPHGAKPTHKGGGPIKQPGGGFRGN